MRLLTVALGASIWLASGAARADDVATAKSEEVPRAPQRRRVDTGLFAAGLATAITGGVALNVGATVALLADDKSAQMTGLGVLLIGAAMIAGGIPLAIAGGRKETVPAPVQAQAGLVPILTF